MTDVHKVTGVILAGGLGTRLHSLLPGQQKVIAEVNGRPFIRYLLDQIQGADIKTVVLCTGYLGDKVETTVGNRYKDIEIFYSKESKPLGTGGALNQVFENFNSHQYLVMNGDSYIQCDIRDFVDWHNKKRALVSIVLKESLTMDRFGRVEIDEFGKITEFSEKEEKAFGGLINAGVYLFGSRAVQFLPHKIPLSLERQVFPSLVGKEFFGYKDNAKFIDIGTGESYMKAQDFFLNIE